MFGLGVVVGIILTVAIQLGVKYFQKEVLNEKENG
jgi:hypothetical protein